MTGSIERTLLIWSDGRQQIFITCFWFRIPVWMLMYVDVNKFWKRFQARLAGNSHKKGRFSDSKTIKKFSQCLLAVRSYYDRLRSRSSAAYVRSDRWRNWPTRIKRINILGTWKIHAQFLCLKQHETTETTSLCPPFFLPNKNVLCPVWTFVKVLWSERNVVWSGKHINSCHT